MSFQEIQKLYAIIGAFFLPAPAAALLYFNRSSRVGPLLHNRWPSIVVLAATLLFFGWVALQGGGGE